MVSIHALSGARGEVGGEQNLIESEEVALLLLSGIKPIEEMNPPRTWLAYSAYHSIIT